MDLINDILTLIQCTKFINLWYSYGFCFLTWICYVILNSVIYRYYLYTAGMAWNYILVTFKTFSTDEWPLALMNLWCLCYSNVCSWNSLCMLLNSWHDINWQELYLMCMDWQETTWVYGVQNVLHILIIWVIKKIVKLSVWHPSLYINILGTAVEIGSRFSPPLARLGGFSPPHPIFFHTYLILI
jgi:hypothetical protein